MEKVLEELKRPSESKITLDVAIPVDKGIDAVLGVLDETTRCLVLDDAQRECLETFVETRNRI